MANVKKIREGLAKNLRPLGNDVQVSAYALTNPTPPSVMVDGPSVEYHRASGNGLEPLMFTIVAIVSLGSERGAQERLDELIAPEDNSRSLRALLESDLTLAGAVGDLTVRSCTGPKTYTLDSSTGTQRGPYLGAEWVVEVWP